MASACSSRCRSLPGLYMIRINGAGERSFTYWRDSAPARRLLDLPGTEAVLAGLMGARLVYLSGITLSLFPATARDRLFAFLARYRAGGGTVAFDTNFRPRAWPDPAAAERAFAGALQQSDIVLGGLEDYRHLRDRPAEPDEMIDWLVLNRVREGVIKLFSPESVVIEGTERNLVTLPSPSVPADTTAAGDSFAAAYLAARLQGCPPSHSALAGHRLADIVIRHRGALIPRVETPRSVAQLLEPSS